MCLQTYVQHLLKKNADKVVKQLIEERGHFYVCGDISMAADVCRTLQVCVCVHEWVCVVISQEARSVLWSQCMVLCFNFIHCLTNCYSWKTSGVMKCWVHRNSWKLLVQ